MTSRINHALFREVARRHASRVEIYSAALTRRKTIPRCAARYMVSHGCVFSWIERDDPCTGDPRSDTSSYARAVYHGGRGFAGGLHSEPFCGLPRLLYAARLFSRRCRGCTVTRRCTGSNSRHVRSDASCRATPPWFRAIGRVSALMTLHSCRTGRSIRANFQLTTEKLHVSLEIIFLL